MRKQKNLLISPVTPSQTRTRQDQMARKRRKEERGNGAAKERKKRRFDNPADTNLEVLPTKILAVDPDSSLQVQSRPLRRAPVNSQRWCQRRPN